MNPLKVIVGLEWKSLSTVVYNHFRFIRTIFAAGLEEKVVIHPGEIYLPDKGAGVFYDHQIGGGDDV